MCVFSSYTSATYEISFLTWNIKGHCDFLRFSFLVIVNLQYLTILIKSALHDVNSQFQYRRPNCEI